MTLTTSTNGEIKSLAAGDFNADGLVDLIMLDHEGYLAFFERALVDGEGGVLTCPWHGYKYQALTGECISAADKRLDAHPARVDGGHVWVRLGA